jgi:hypothetical protein
MSGLGEAAKFVPTSKRLVYRQSGPFVSDHFELEHAFSLASPNIAGFAGIACQPQATQVLGEGSKTPSLGG